ncbi:FISUMP domain-containing protein [Pontimicrobium sp. MEBiC01747]
MPSTKITLKDAQDLLKEFNKAYRNFYQNSQEHKKIADNRTNTKTHDFYEQASKDVKEFVNPNGFSGSWIWGLFIDEQLKKPEKKRRFFNNTYLEYFESLIVFYQDHIFIKYDDKGKSLCKINNAIDKILSNELEHNDEPNNENSERFNNKDKIIDNDYLSEEEISKSSEKAKLESESKITVLKKLNKWLELKKVIGFVLIITVAIHAYNFFTKQKLPFEEIKIGDQIWSSEINIPIENSFCYGDVEHNCQSLGRLYTYMAAKKIANQFDGWELPISQDFEKLIDYLGKKEAMPRLMKGGNTGFNASLSGYGSYTTLENDSLFEFINIGKETAFWTSSISNITDNSDENRPFALRLLKSGTYMNVCDCWTTKDALSLRLIKTNRGYIQNFIRDEISEEDKKEEIANGNKVQLERLKILNNIYEQIDKELKRDNKKRSLTKELIARIIVTNESLNPYIFYKKDKAKFSSPERANLFLKLLKSNLSKDTLEEILFNTTFQEADFSELDLSNLNFAENLHGIVGSYKTELQGLITPIKRIDFSSADFQGANLDNTILYGNFIAANFSNTSLKNTSFIWSQLNSTLFTNSTLNNVSFKYSNLNLADFQKTKFVGGKGFTNCDLRNVNFNNSSFLGDGRPFVFENNFMSSKGTFFEYKLHSEPQTISIEGYPFIEESPLIEEDTYYIYRDINSYEGIPPLIKTIDLDSAFTFFGSKEYEKNFFSLLRIKDVNNKIQHYTVRTNDNINRGSKSLRTLIRFNDHNWDISEVISDTFYRESSLNKLQIKYRGLIYDYKTKDTTLVTASFKNCTFKNTHFKNSSLEYVSFKNSKFINDREINNYFINSKLYSNDFRIRDGLFFFDYNTEYNNLLVNKNFPLIKFLNKKNYLLNNTSYKKHLIKKQKYKIEGTSYVNLYQEDTEKKLEWIKYFEKQMKIDSVEFNGKKKLLLRKIN